MQHDRWLRHGRRYHHQDEGKPNTYTLTTRIGEVNVDVDGDGQTFAPYVLDGARLRHGDAECEFADGWQTIKRLGQTLVSQSRLYVQRDVDGTWTDVPHGIPTRNIAHDYPKEGKCTAYLDFDQIQGYASGARLQIGVEVGGNDRQTLGFRFRSPIAGTFRLEWVLELPESADLASIVVPTSKTDSTPITIGCRIGQTEIRWSRVEAPNRSATIEDNPLGGKILRIILGPYTVAAMDWLTIYPDTVAGGMESTDDVWQIYDYDGNESWTFYTGGWYGRYNGSNEPGGFRFLLDGGIEGTITNATVTIDGAGDNKHSVHSTYIGVTEAQDAGQVTSVGGRPYYIGGTTHTYPDTDHDSDTTNWVAWDTSAWETYPRTSSNIASLIQHLVNAYDFSVARHITVWLDGAAGQTDENAYDETYYLHSLSITYTPAIVSGTDVLWFRRRFMGAVDLRAAEGGPETYEETGSGGATCSGTAAINLQVGRVASGGAACSGTAITTTEHVCVASGGATASGTAAVNVSFVPATSGGVTCSGAATVSFDPYEAPAGATWAEEENTNITSPAGTLRLRIQVRCTGDPTAIVPLFDYRYKSAEGVFGSWRGIPEA